MKILIIGGVAAGTKAAAKLKRCNRDADVRILTKSTEISYAGCGLPYFVGGSIEDRSELVVNTPEKFSALTGAAVTVGCEATAVDTSAKRVSWRMQSGETGSESYDKLIIAVGAAPFIPRADGVDLPGVFAVRTPDDAQNIKEYIERTGCRRAVVCGAGFIGLEMAENLSSLGLSVTVIDAAETIMPSAFDTEMADYVKRQLQQEGIRVLTGTSLSAIEGDGKAEAVVTNAGRLPADIVIMAIGIRPATAFLEGSGIEMHRGTIVTDENMQTNIPDVYAAGDCAEVRNLITGKPQWSAMGSTANITARLLARNITGGSNSYGGCLGTGVAKVLPHLNCGRTGLTAIVIGLCFLLAMFFTPLIAAVAGYPPVTSGALVVVGAMMMRSISEIRWDDCTEGIPAFLIFAGIPFSNSIIGGISVGIILYPFLKACCGKIRELNWFIWLAAAVLILYLVLLNGK